MFTRHVALISWRPAVTFGREGMLVYRSTWLVIFGQSPETRTVKASTDL